MANLVSSWCKNVKGVPENYVYPEGMRPDLNAPICKEIPIIDLSSSDNIAEKVFNALDEYGGFQVINHGLTKKLTEDALKVYNEFFNLPIEDKEKYIKDRNNSRSNGLYNGGEDPEEKVHPWRDALIHSPCYPIEQSITSWPEKPLQYRKVIAEYVSETRKLSQKIFELIAEGLGLEKKYFDDIKYTENQTLRANYYPRCPDPSLTTGFGVHYDPNFFTLIQQNAIGLQLLKDGKWMIVEPLDNGFFVLPGIELQIFSNGRFKATLHQVATNPHTDRLSIGIFMSAPENMINEPEKEFIVSDENPQKYKDYSFQKYTEIFQSKILEYGKISLVEACKLSLDSFLIKD